MIYKAQVISNSDFLTKGTIRVRISKYFFGAFKDLSEHPELITEGLYYSVDSQGRTLKHQDTDVKVFSPIGGGNDYGMFFIPQVNTEGLVLMLGEAFETSNEFIWLGSMFEMKNNTIKMPSDKMSTVNGVENGISNLDVINGALVIKLRSTDLVDQTNPEDSAENLNWETRPIENLIVINKNKVLINHSDGLGSNSVIELDNDGAEITYVSDTALGKIGINKDGSFFLQSNKFEEDKFTSITSKTADTIEMMTVNGDSTSTLTLAKDTTDIIVNNGSANSSIGIGTNGITLKTSESVYVDSDEVRLGPDGLRVVLAAVDDSVSSCEVDGLTLKFSKSVRG